MVWIENPTNESTVKENKQITPKFKLQEVLTVRIKKHTIMMKIKFQLILALTAYSILISCEKDINDDNRLADVDGNTYNTESIGTQVWMTENLKTTRFNDHTEIPHITDKNEWRKLEDNAYCFYVTADDSDTLKDLGALYNWYTVRTGKLCPSGWHIPSDEEWETLEDYLADNSYNYDESIGGNNNKIAKSLASTSEWKISSEIGSIGNEQSKNNKSNFTGMPNGYRTVFGNFRDIGESGYWWSSSDRSGHGSNRYLTYSHCELRTHQDAPYQYGFSIRCIKD